MSKNKKGNYIAKKGKPSGPGHEKAGLKEVNLEKLDETLELEDRYLENEDEVGESVPERHPNRNLNKVNINKPSYS